MWFSLFVVVLILAVTFYQGLLGVFTASINFFLTVLAATLAFGLYESVYFNYLIDRQPDDGRAIVLMAIFFVSLLVMRIIVDMVITDNMHFSVYVDRVGGGIFGFLTAMLVIGTLSIGIQMLPFPAQWLGFSRYAMFDADTGEAVALTSEDEDVKEADVLAAVDLSKVNFVRKNVWLNPDGFTVGLVSHLSDNALAGGNSFSGLHAEFLDDLYWTRFTQTGQKTTVARKPDALRVEACWELPDDALYVWERGKDNKNVVFSEPTKGEQKIEAGNRYLAVRVQLSADASDDGTNYRFTTGQVRLLTRESGRTETYYLVGVSDPDLVHPKDRQKSFYYRLVEGESVVRKTGKVDLVFEVPEDAEPWFIEFRRNARAEIKRVEEEAPSASPAASGGKPKAGSGGAGGSTNSGTAGAPPKREFNRHTESDRSTEARTGGRVNRTSSDLEGSFFSNELPFDLTQYTNNDVEVRGDTVVGGGGRIIAKFTAEDMPVQGTQTPLRKFEVPQGKQLLQLSTTRLHAGSTLGQALSFAGQVKNVAVFDEAGKEYRAIGLWAVATVGSERVFELVYFDQTTRTSGAAVPQTSNIGRDNMQRDYLYYYLFEVPPRVKIVRYLAGRGNGEDLTEANLVAPG